VRVQAGEIVHNLRACLNQIVAIAVVAGDGEVTKRTDFPIYEDAGKFRDNASSKIKGVPPGFLEMIATYEPHGSSEDKRLWWLSELNNQDKHEALLATGESTSLAGVDEKY